MNFRRSLLAAVAWATSTALGVFASAAPRISIALDPSLPAVPSPARIVVFLIASDAPLRPDTPPIDGPFWDSEQPIFGCDVESLGPGRAVALDAQADGYPFRPAELKPGRYRAQAGLIARRQSSKWRRTEGNLYSDIGSLEIDPNGNGAVLLTLKHATTPPERTEAPGIEWFSTPSKLLSEFREADVALRAGVLFPLEYNPARSYPAIYLIPGFGGDDTDALRVVRRRAESTGVARELAKETFVIVLNPESPNGHTLFADSANNGPCSRALVEELIPALESRFNLIATPRGRILQGHSSGGWSSLWLLLTRPDVFGATWSSAPDPVDFRKFQSVNIYADENFYSDPATGADRTSFRRYDAAKGISTPVMTIRREARQEDVLGPDNTSGQQWDSWFAVAGPRNQAGNPAALFDPVTGVIDRTVAEKYRAFDIGGLVRADPGRYVPLFDERVHLLVGEADNFFLNEAVSLLKADLDALRTAGPRGESAAPARSGGYIKVVPGRDHGSIMASPEAREAPAEMLKFLRENGPP